jgi:hypothetical protein
VGCMSYTPRQPTGYEPAAVNASQP